MTKTTPIRIGSMAFARYLNMTHRTATVVKIQDTLISRTSVRPFKTLITLEYLDDGSTADMDLSFFRSNWQSAGTTRFGAVDR